MSFLTWSSQTGGATVYRALKDTLKEHVLDDSDDQISIIFSALQRNRDTSNTRPGDKHPHVCLKLITYTLISPRPTTTPIHSE